MESDMMKFRRLIKEARETALEMSGEDFLCLSIAANPMSVICTLETLEKTAQKVIDERGC